MPRPYQKGGGPLEVEAPAETRQGWGLHGLAAALRAEARVLPLELQNPYTQKMVRYVLVGLSGCVSIHVIGGDVVRP
jgi:hypothetical protein